MKASASLPSERRHHDLDWLRVVAFVLLIFYHVGMFYVAWGWHVKSLHASPFLEPFMSMLTPWRLALLFFISGVAVRFALDKVSMRRFLRERIVRLLAPLVFGMAVIVMPQAYIELLVKGELDTDILTFWTVYLGVPPGPFSITIPTWNHLWYVAYLLVYSVVVAVASPWLKLIATGPASDVFRRMAEDPFGLLVLGAALPFLAYRFWLDPIFPTTHAMADDWANHAHSLTIFVFGYLAAKNNDFWCAVSRHWPRAAVLSIGLAVAIIVSHLHWEEVRSDRTLYTAVELLRALYAWAVILALLGIARRWFDRPGKALNYLTQAILPYYILHQTLIVLIGFALLDTGIAAPLEAAILILGTSLGCAFSYEIIRRIAPLRPLFGLPLREKRTAFAKGP